jgi:hypothetical protein
MKGGMDTQRPDRRRQDRRRQDRRRLDRRQRSPMRTFDPDRIGTYETAAWVAYYRKEWMGLLRAAVSLVRSTYRMPWPRTLRGAWLVLRANQRWAPYPHNKPDAARELMRRFYGLVLKTHDQPLDAAEAARLEVDWWRAHREMQHGSDEGLAALESALTRLYAYVYGVPAESVHQAAYRRARAMVISDRWVAAGCDINSPDIRLEREELIRSYATLRTAVGTAVD